MQSFFMPQNILWILMVVGDVLPLEGTHGMNFRWFSLILIDAKWMSDDTSFVVDKISLFIEILMTVMEIEIFAIVLVIVVL
jgi:hypothetical protein